MMRTWRKEPYSLEWSLLLILVSLKSTSHLKSLNFSQGLQTLNDYDYDKLSVILDKLSQILSDHRGCLGMSFCGPQANGLTSIL